MVSSGANAERLVYIPLLLYKLTINKILEN